MTSFNTNLNLLLENLLFFSVATAFIGLVGWAWRHSKPFDLPQPLPEWFKVWFGTVQVGGGLVPLLVLFWGAWRGDSSVLTVLVPYFVMLGLQILSEVVTLRQFKSVVWVMVPYLYLPYRLWQLYKGIGLLGCEPELLWVRNLLIAEIIVWSANYALDLSQLPRLLRWEVQQDNNLP